MWAPTHEKVRLPGGNAAIVEGAVGVVPGIDDRPFVEMTTDTVRIPSAPIEYPRKVPEYWNSLQLSELTQFDTTQLDAKLLIGEKSGASDSEEMPELVWETDESQTRANSQTSSTKSRGEFFDTSRGEWLPFSRTEERTGSISCETEIHESLKLETDMKEFLSAHPISGDDVVFPSGQSESSSFKINQTAKINAFNRLLSETPGDCEDVMTVLFAESRKKKLESINNIISAGQNHSSSPWSNECADDVSRETEHCPLLDSETDAKHFLSNRPDFGDNFIYRPKDAAQESAEFLSSLKMVGSTWEKKRSPRDGEFNVGKLEGLFSNILITSIDLQAKHVIKDKRPFPPECFDHYLSVGNGETEEKIKFMLQTGIDLVVLDFDYTMTQCGSQSGWCLFNSSSFSSKETKERLEENYKKYMPVETHPGFTKKEKAESAAEWYAQSMKIMGDEWKDLETMKRSMEIFDKEIRVDLKPGVVDALKLLRDYKIPCIVFSAGLGDLVERVLLEHDPHAFNVSIVSNYRLFDGKRYTDHSSSEKCAEVTWSEPTITCASKSLDTMIKYFACNPTHYQIPKTESDVFGARLKMGMLAFRTVLLAGDVLSDADMMESEMFEHLFTERKIFKVGFHTLDYFAKKKRNFNGKISERCEEEEEETVFLSKEGDPLYTTTPAYFGKTDDLNNRTKKCHLLLGQAHYDYGKDQLRAMIEKYDHVLLNHSHATFEPVTCLIEFFTAARTNTSDAKPDRKEGRLEKDYKELLSTAAEETPGFSTSGFAGSGKDSFYEVLKRNVETTKVAFADKLREIAYDLNPLIPFNDDKIPMVMFHKIPRKKIHYFVDLRSTAYLRQKYYEKMRKKEIANPPPFERKLDTEGNYKPVCAMRYRDLLTIFGYENAKKYFPCTRKLLIAIGEGAREVFDPKTWILWAFHPHKKLYEIMQSEMGRTLPDSYVKCVKFLEFVYSFSDKAEINWRPNATFLSSTQSYMDVLSKYFFDARYIDNFVKGYQSEVSKIRSIAIVKHLKPKSEMTKLFLSSFNACCILCLNSISYGTLEALSRKETIPKENAVAEILPERHLDLVRAVPRIFTDARYKNECCALYSRGMHMAWIVNPKVDPEKAPPSEKLAYKGLYYNVVVNNDSTLDDYEKGVTMIFLIYLFYKCSGHYSMPILDFSCSNFATKPSHSTVS